METLLSIDISRTGVTAVKVMAYSSCIEEEADRVYKAIKTHLDQIDQTLSVASQGDHQ
jgi:hypothetical protein